MELYHNDDSFTVISPTPTPTATTAPTPTSSQDPNDIDCPSDDDYDRLRRGMLAKVIQNEGWRTELRRYLDYMPSNVTKDTDVVEWWGVSHALLVQRPCLDCSMFTDAR
jgi:hypothetical protein